MKITISKLNFFKKTTAFLFFFIILLLIINNATAASNGSDGEFLSRQWVRMDSSLMRDTIQAQEFLGIPGSGVKPEGDSLLLPVDGAVEFFADVEKDGRYNIVVEYEIKGSKVLKNTVTLKWENGELMAALPMLWKDADKKYRKDRYGNEMAPAQEILAGRHFEYIKDYCGLDKKPVSFELKKGRCRFTLKNNTQQLLLHAVYVLEENSPPSYEEYLTKAAGEAQGSGMAVIEAEDYSLKSDSFIRSANVQNSAVAPYKTDMRLINTIADTAWKEAGQKILWEFDIEKAGLYNIGFRYSQSKIQGMPVFRNVELDGRMPVEELRAVPFAYTGMGYANLVLKNAKGEAVKLWIDSGRHTISMEADAAPLGEAVKALKDIAAKINDTSIDIKKLTGSGKDSNRSWDIGQYLPDIDKSLCEWAEGLEAVYGKLEKVSGQNPVYAVKLKMAAKNLRELALEPEKLPARLTKLSEGSGSASQLIADSTRELSEQPMSLDRIYVFYGCKLPDAQSGFFKNLLESLKGFIGSFFVSDGFRASAGGDSNELEVWVNRPIQYAEMLQTLADSEFSPKTGINVKFSVMPNETKLILADSSHSNPDLALGISSHIPYELAIRGAIADLSEFNDFLTYTSREYNLESLIPYCIDNGIYGVTETQDFYVLMYRKDIMNKLRLPVPDTWEDVKAIMPELQRHSMGFYLPMSGWVGLKPFYTTVPFIYQNGGSVYNPDGMSTAIGDEKAVSGFKLMTELFSIYSIEENASNFYNSFRYGTIPIGVANFSTYSMLMNAAPEIADLWEIALSPGVRDGSGKVLRYQAANDKADVLFSNSSKKEQGWELLKWWLSKEVQMQYANSMQTRYGPEYMWNTANLAAFEEMPIPEQHKNVILEQWRWAKEIPRHPGGYIVEREISNAWTDVVMGGKNLRISVDKAVLAANREMRRKLEEFGYIEDGKTIGEYRIPTVEDIKERVREGK